MKRTILVGAAWLAVLAPQAAHAQLAVYDATTYAKVLQQARTAAKQLQQLQQQLSQAQQLYASLNNPSNIASIATSLLGVPPILTSDLRSFANVASGDFSALGAAGARAQQIRATDRIYTPSGSTDALSFYDQALEQSGNRLAASQAVSEQAYTVTNQRAQGLAQLRDAIPAATDARGVADLQARISVEEALIQNDQMRLQALQMQQQTQSSQASQQTAEEVAKEGQARAALFRSMHP